MEPPRGRATTKNRTQITQIKLCSLWPDFDNTVMGIGRIMYDQTYCNVETEGFCGRSK